MDLASPLQSLAPTLDAAVLEVLAGTESAFSTTQIHRLAPRGSRPGLRLALERLVETGLVHAHPSNRGFMFSFNHDHVLAEMVLNAINVRKVIQHRIRERLQGFEPRLTHASLFGSFARREGGPHSDIDLLLVADDTASTRDVIESQALELADSVKSWTGNSLQFLLFSETEFQDIVSSGSPMLSQWKTDGVTLIGPDPADLLESLAVAHPTSP